MKTITKGLVLGINKKEIIKVGENITLEYFVDDRGNKRVVISAPKETQITRVKKEEMNEEFFNR